MRKLILVVVAIFVSQDICRAQETPRAEFSVGYSYLREGFSGGVNANGGSFSLAGNLNRWFGVAGDFGAYHASPFGVSANTYTYLLGPRFSYRRASHVTPFAQVLLGGAHLTAAGGGSSGSANGFAYSGGGGMDLGISKHLALRPQFDYIGIRSGSTTLHTGRASFGIVFRFGGE
jgi:Outer membrane protein beta-barrel domain